MFWNVPFITVPVFCNRSGKPVPPCPTKILYPFINISHVFIFSPSSVSDECLFQSLVLCLTFLASVYKWRLLWELGLIVSCVGWLGPMSVVFSGDACPDETGSWRWGNGGCYRFSWTEEGPLKQRLADLAQTSGITLGNERINGRNSSSSIATFFCTVSVLYISHLFNRPGLITEISPTTPGIMFLQRRPCPSSQAAPYNWLSDRISSTEDKTFLTYFT